jgi:hypothetical protein
LRKSSKTALGGIIAAASVALMFILSVFPYLTYALPAAAGALLIFLTIEIDKKWAFGVFAATGILSAMLVPDKEAAILYIAFFGYYPIIKSYIESKFKSRVFEYFVKLMIFNFTVTVSYFLMIRFMGITLDTSESFGRFAVPVLLIMGNVTFFAYDFALTRIISVYLHKWQRHFRKIFK